MYLDEKVRVRPGYENLVEEMRRIRQASANDESDINDLVLAVEVEMATRARDLIPSEHRRQVLEEVWKTSCALIGSWPNPVILFSLLQLAAGDGQEREVRDILTDQAVLKSINVWLALHTPSKEGWMVSIRGTDVSVDNANWRKLYAHHREAVPV